MPTTDLKVLGLDPATACGWSHSDGSFGVVDLSRGPDESSGVRLVRLWNFLDEIRESKGIDILGFESSMNMKGSGIKVQARFEGVILLFAEKLGIPYRGFNPMELKKISTGKGNSQKEAMIDFAMTVRPKAKREKMTHDMADAICVMRAIENEMGKAPKELL